MRRRQLLAFSASMLALTLTAASVWAQPPLAAGSHRTIAPSHVFYPEPAEEPAATHPLVHPGVFDYDAQIWAPPEYPIAKQQPAATGFHLTYERSYLSVSRPGPQTLPFDEVPIGHNWQWGNRWTGGWMTPEGDGFSVQYLRSDGIFFAHGQDVLIATPMLVNITMDTVHVNRIFRQHLKRGDYVEPYMGVRYFSLSDNTLEDRLVGPDLWSTRFKQNVTNSAVGGQVGARYVARRGRWKLSADGALAATYNSQRYFATDLPDVGFVFETYRQSDGFVPIFDLQCDAAFHLTRDMALKLGAQVLWAWDGIARANTHTTGNNPNSVFGVGLPGPPVVDEGFIAAGIVFGVEWNR